MLSSTVRYMFKTATKVLQMGSGLALFPRLECALAFSWIEPILVISVLCLTWAGFSCRSYRSETCDCAFAALHAFSIDCSLIQPADTPCFKSFFPPPLSLYALAQGRQSTICVEAAGSSLSVPYFSWNWVCSVGTFFLWRRCVEGTTEEQEGALCKALSFTCLLWPHCKIGG